MDLGNRKLPGGFRIGNSLVTTKISHLEGTQKRDAERSKDSLHFFIHPFNKYMMITYCRPDSNFVLRKATK